MVYIERIRIRTIARELRKNSTFQEKRLWTEIRNRKVSGFKFRRQYPVGPYFLDFFCPKKKLAIEVDGSVHLDIHQRIYDMERENFLKSKGIFCIRFSNDDIEFNLEKVLEDIFRALAA